MVRGGNGVHVVAADEDYRTNQGCRKIEGRVKVSFASRSLNKKIKFWFLNEYIKNVYGFIGGCKI